ncbi:MAG: RagB/SusD family nutrient uptake outer membrane protein [Flavicella sp.]
MRKILTYIKFFLFTMLFICCDASTLDEVPKGVVSEEVFFNAKENAEMALRGAYYKVGSSFNGYGIWQYVIEDLGVDYGVGGWFDSFPYSSYSDWSATNPDFIDWGLWGNFWDLIFQNNRLLERIPAIQMDTTSKDRILGEAYGLRALAYFSLLNWFGPVAEITSASEKRLEIPRGTLASNYRLIETDLTNAIALLPTKSAMITMDETEYGRLSKGAVQGLLVKVYLEQHKWSAAASLALEIIESNEYALEANYLDVFSMENEGYSNTELLWTIPFTSPSMAEPQQSQLLQVYLFKAPEISSYNHFNQWGGTIRITSAFYESFEQGDLRKNGLFYSNTAAFYGVDNPVMLLKYPADKNATGSRNGNDFPFIRYADILLMRAEALNNLGNQSDAIVEINKVRTRAGLPPLDETQYDQEALASQIVQERRWEFYFEGHGKRDLKRMHPELLKDHIKSVSSDWETKGVESYFILPIPANAIRANPLLEQNPGF